MLLHPSIAGIQEAELVDLLLGDTGWRSRVVGLAGIPDDVVVYQRIPLEAASSDEKDLGDIDILLCPPGGPDQSTAIQVKRLKAQAFSAGQADTLGDYDDGVPFCPGQVNGVGNLAEGVRQANHLARIGFSQVYLYVFVVGDAREQTAKQGPLANITPELRSFIDSKVRDSQRDLDPRVGLFRCEFIQPEDEVPLGPGAFTGSLIRLAQHQTQSQHLTQSIAGVQREHSPTWAAPTHVIVPRP